jgi:flagellar hook-basal body complex protein FliE
MQIEGIRGSLALTPSSEGVGTKPLLPTDGGPAGVSGMDGLGGTAPTKTGAVSFEDLLTSEVNNAAALGHVADAKADALSRGTLDDIHGTMIAAKEAEISLHLVGTIRNRLLDAFHELWRTGV